MCRVLPLCRLAWRAGIREACGEHVSQGQPLISFSSEAIARAGLDDTVMVVVSNTADYQTVELVAPGEVAAGQPLLVVAG